MCSLLFSPVLDSQIAKQTKAREEEMRSES